jgi:hypothetical protein
MADIFGRTKLTIEQPLTADACGVRIDNEEQGEAFQLQLEYTQQVTRRRSIGNNSAVIYGSQPVGRLTIQRLMTESTEIPKSKTFNGCGQGKVTITVAGKACEPGSGSKIGTSFYDLEGCMATSYTLQIQAEDLTVIDGITIEFLEMSRTQGS